MAMSEAVISVDSIMYEIDNGREYQLEQLTPEQIDEMIKAVEEIRRMHKQQREMNKYYEEWRKSR